MRPLRRAALALLGAALTSAGCSTDHGTLQLVSFDADPETLRGLDLGARPVERDVVGRDTRITSVLFVPTFDGPTLERAVDDALARGGGDVLLGADVRTTEYWFLVGWSVLEVRGEIADSREREDAP